MLTKVPETPGDDVLITPETPTQQPSKALPEEKSTRQPSQHPAYPPPHQPIHEDIDQPNQQPKRYEDILAYEDKWVGWDGPVWCSRYGRFENQEDAAADDGYKSVGQVPHTGIQTPISSPLHNFLPASADRLPRSRAPTLREARLRL